MSKFGSALRRVYANQRPFESLEDDFVEIDVMEVDTAEVDAAEVDAVEVDAAEVDTAEFDAVEVDTAEVDAAEVDAVEVDTAEVDAGEVDAVEVDTAEVDAGEVDAAEVDTVEVDAVDPCAGRTLALDATTLLDDPDSICDRASMESPESANIEDTQPNRHISSPITHTDNDTKPFGDRLIEILPYTPHPERPDPSETKLNDLQALLDEAERFSEAERHLETAGPSVVAVQPPLPATADVTSAIVSPVTARSISPTELVIQADLEDANLRRQYETLRVQLQKQLGGSLRGCVVFFGPTDHDASSELVSQLGAYLAASEGTSVLLVDADPREHRLSRHFQVHGQAGLAEAALGNITTTQTFLKTSFPNLNIVAAGNADQFEDLTPQDMRTFMEACQQAFDLVLVAAGRPQELASPLLSDLGDANLLTVCLGENDREQVMTDRKRLQAVGIEVDATVVVNAKPEAVVQPKEAVVHPKSEI